ncbi:hypothetical protein [Paenirhodobacter hankyongi]|nr:hypothetical protein [Sinirhodobacter hankyongi]
MTTATTIKPLVPKLYAGQPDAETLTWFRAKYPNGITAKSSRAYARELYKTKPDREEDPAGEQDWYSSLTDFQEKLLADANRQKRTDPKVKAARARARAADPEYQTKLAKTRMEYADRAEAEGREVRSYRRNVTLTPDQKKTERNERNEKRREHIRTAIGRGQNPFAPSKQHVAFMVCARLLEMGRFDPINDPVVSDLAQKLSITEDAVRKLVGGAIETLRTAKAIRKDGAVIVLR